MSEIAADRFYDVAIVGMAGRFPGASDLAQFWANLRSGAEAITFFDDETLLAAGVPARLVERPDYVKARGIIQDVACFDAQFFGYSPREAALMDPQQRIFLECAWHALEDAGHDTSRYDGYIGLYAGVGFSSYLWQGMANGRQEQQESSFYQMALGNDKDFLATQTAYKLNLKGPCLTIQTACSTSLVAVHAACQALLNHECDMALAGGVRLILPQEQGYFYQSGDINSPDGHCRPFDAQAQGTLSGNGVGIVVLKRFADAVVEGNSIYAVIKGSAVNNDGSRKIGYTAPSEDGQVEVISKALAMADVAPESISYIEAHGTGTSLGDPIEVAALTRAFGSMTPAKRFCALGAVKSNIGHLDAAAGIAGLIKTVLALKNKQLPPTLHFTEPNPQIHFEETPFYVNDSLSAWPETDHPRRAGVSSFGIGGTNAHVILEEAPPPPPTEPDTGKMILPLSAKTETAVDELATRLATYLSQNPDTINLADVAYTLQVGRRPFSQRQFLVANTVTEAASILEKQKPTLFTGCTNASQPPLYFLFPGQGSQYVNMGKTLFETEAVFRDTILQCHELLQTHLDVPLLTLLYPEPETTAEAQAALQNTCYTQPALFALEYALAVLWRHWGVQPEGLLGHSIGEYVAACLAGVFSLASALRIVARRGQLIQNLPGGSMLSLPLSEEQTQPYLSQEISLAAVNGPQFCTLSGPDDAIEALIPYLAAQGITGRRLHTSHAFHSAMMAPILDDFAEFVARMPRNRPAIPFISGVTGTWITDAEATDPSYWAQQIRQPVRFCHGLQTLAATTKAALFLEVGPGHTLSTFARQQQINTVFTSLPHPYEKQDDRAHILTTVGHLWLGGTEIAWQQLYGKTRRRRISLPLYPFARDSYWVGGQNQTAQTHNQDVTATRPAKADIDDWFYAPSWQRVPEPVPDQPSSPAMAGERWVVFGGQSSLSRAFRQRLQQAQKAIILVRKGDQFARVDETSYRLQPNQAEDYRRLIQALQKQDTLPTTIIYLWGIREEANEEAQTAVPTSAPLADFFALLFLGQALSQLADPSPVRLVVVTNNMQDVMGDDLAYPEKATVLGPVKVIPQELPHVSCLTIDLDTLRPGTPHTEQIVSRLLAEVTSATEATAVAYRAGYRWRQTFVPMPLNKSRPHASRLRPGGVYLITGGFGRIGTLLARHLAQNFQAKLILISRTPLPPHDQAEPAHRKHQTIQTLEAWGAEVLPLQADVADETAMRQAIRQAQARFGQIHGVIHAAGLVGTETLQPILTAEINQCQQQFQAKLFGLIVLEKVIRDIPLDFCLLMSSLSAVLGGIGFAAYTAANCFMDAFAQKQNQKKRVPWLTVNWDAWSFESDDKNPFAAATTTRAATIQIEEGIEAWERILSPHPATHIVVSASDLQERIEQWVLTPFRLQQESAMPEAKMAPRYPRPDLPNPYAAPTTDIEAALAALWAQLLGIEAVGIHDNFFGLGGHSLLAIQLISGIRNTFQVEVSVETIFERSTIAELAQVIAAEQSAVPAEDLAQIAEMLQYVEQLSDNELQALLGAQEAAPGHTNQASQTSPPGADGRTPFAGQHALHRQPKEKTRETYNLLTQQIDKTIFGQHSRFLNYGYAAGESQQFSSIALPSHMLNKNSARLVLEVIGDCDLTNCRLLDVGCGRGGAATLIANHFTVETVIGLDISSSAIAFCRRANQFKHVHYLEGDAERLPFGGHSFDVVLNIESSGNYPDMIAFYRHVYRVLYRNGRFLYADLLPTAHIDDYLNHLQDVGFAIESKRDITKNVLLSCDETADKRLAAFDQDNAPEFMNSFLAVPGSAVYTNMEARTMSYWIFKLRKE